MKPTDAQGFEEKFQIDIDPWNYRSSHFEAIKRRDLLHACGLRVFGRGLELGCAIGVTSRDLSRRCLRLCAIDGSQTALAEARLGRHDRRPDFRWALLPHDFPVGRFDLIVISEVAYYLPPRQLAVLVEKVLAGLAPGGRVVNLHHLRPFDDAATKPERAQCMLDRAFEKRLISRMRYRRRHYAVSAFEKARG